MKYLLTLVMLSFSVSSIAQNHQIEPLPWGPDPRLYLDETIPPDPQSRIYPGDSQSIMFGTPQSAPAYMPPPPVQPSLGYRCQQMARDIEMLEGKPQRRYSLMQRYNYECGLRY